jgi:tetratricopeptide (TPR) repeat protein
MKPASPQNSAAFYLREGDAFAEQGRWSQAQASFAMAMQLAPKASLTWLSYALSCFPQQLYGPAGSAIEDALHYAVPILDSAEIRKGLEAYEAQEWAEAERWFEAALAMGAPDSAPHLLLAISQLRQGKAADALSHLVTAKNMEEAGAEKVGTEESQPS